jgi:ubiquinone/menaquinone biosynthesis C-methylase UbiE
VVSLNEREHAERRRSSLEASETSRAATHLVQSAETVARYSAPSGTTVFPLEYAFHLLGDVDGKTILEYGCGDGLNTAVLADRGAKVIALDISDELLAIARTRLEVNGCEEVDLLIGSAHALPLQDESIDIIFGMAILHHLDLDLASRETWRVLKNGGRAIFEEPLRNSKLVDRVRKLFPVRADVSPFERPLTEEQIEEFAITGTRRARSFQLLLSSIAQTLPFWTRRAIRVSARIDAFLLRLFPSLAYYATVKVFEMVKEEKPLIVVIPSLFLLTSAV